MKQDMIVILDLGSHENTVVARAIRALGVYSEIHPHDITAEELKALPNVKGIIINGGPNNVIDGVAIDVLPEIYQAGFPVMAAGHDKALCEVKLAQFQENKKHTTEQVEDFSKRVDTGVVTLTNSPSCSKRAIYSRRFLYILQYLLSYLYPSGV